MLVVDESQTSPEVNGASTDANRPLNVAVVGAGIGGLAAAIGLRRQGHKVTLYEQSRFAVELGAAIHLAPNANGLLRRWGIFAETFGAVNMERMVEVTPTGEIIKKIEMANQLKIWQHPWQLVHRVKLHDALKKTALGPGPGTPAELHTSSKVIDIDPEAGSLTLEDGTTVFADLLIGADGVYSKARNKVVGKPLELFSSGKSAFRFMIPRAIAHDDPATAKFVEDQNALVMSYASDRRIVMYPCNNNETLNFVCIHPDNASNASLDEGWNRTASLEQLLEVYKDFSPEIKALLAKADPASLKVWTLLDMETPDTWVKGKTALLGDAAHPFTPHQGQGGGVAIEDAASLAVLFPLGTKTEDIPERLKLYESIRYERAHAIQEFSRQAGRDWIDGKPQIDMMKYTFYNFGHDEWDHSTLRFRKWWAEKHPNIYWRTPLSFGPAVGPRQDFLGNPQNGQHSTFRTASIKFKTSRTFLQNLFPNDSYSFVSPGTVAFASFSCTTLNKMNWLGGGGYNHFGLYIHGVQYTKKDGSKVVGRFMPVLFENLTDPIITGRDELGMPKIYSEIDIHSRAHSYHMQCSWRGVTFANFSLEGLTTAGSESTPSPLGPPEDGDLFQRYVPSVGERGKADVNYAVIAPFEKTPPNIKTSLNATNASVKFDKKDWEALPTLHHIISELANVPIYEVVAARVVEGQGVPDVSAARRLE